MKAYFHSLEPVTMPRADYINEHNRLVQALASGDPSALASELVEQRKDLGKAIKGGRGRASGFIMRAMAENKKKHSGAYKNPTFPLAPGSTMNKPIEFDWKKLANKSQGGTPTAGTKTRWGVKGDYGASPFILHHFSGQPTKGKPTTGESDIQRKARLIFTAKQLLAKAKEATAPTVNAAPTIPQNVIEHFGNAAELKSANEPPTPKTEVVEKEPTPPKLVVKEVVAKKPKKKVAESPTPPNPVPRIKWTEAEIKKNPLTRGDTTNYYDELDERQKELFIFALNNPKAKLAEAITFLKSEGIGKGFAPATISPIFKELRKSADEVLAEEDKRNKVLGNPAFANIKSKLDKLLSSKATRPLERVKNAFKGLDVDVFVDTYEGVSEVTDIDEPFELHKNLGYIDEGKWRLYGGKKYAKLSLVLSKQDFNSGIDPDTVGVKVSEHKYQYGAKAYWGTFKKTLEVKGVEGISKDIIIGGIHKDNNRWRIDSEDVTLYLSSSNFEDPVETPEEAIYNTLQSSSGRFPKYKKKTHRAFHLKTLYEFNQSYLIGYYITQWANPEGYYKGRKAKISLARKIKRMIKSLDSGDYEYTTSIDGVEYVSLKKYVAPEPTESPEAPSMVNKPTKTVERPKEWTADNIAQISDRPEETANYFKDLTPDDQELLLWYLNNKTSHPTLPDNSELKLEAGSMLSDFEDRLPKKGGAYRLNKVSDADAKNPEEIRVLPIRNRARYNKARETLLEALSNFTVPPVSTRANLLGKESGTMAGKKSGEGILARGVALGFGNNRRGYDYFVKNKTHPEVYKALVAFGEAIVPKGWDFQTIQLNHNAKAKKHVDKNNVGKSVIIGIGDYNGGELRVFSPDSSKHRDYNIKDRPTMFNGAVLPHETQPFSNPTEYERGKGRYTIVYFRHKYKPSKGNVGVGSGLHNIDTMVGKGLRQPSAAALEDMFV